MTYDDLDRLSAVTDADGGVTRYSYDAVGNRSGVARPNGTRTDYTYDALNRLISLRNTRSDLGVLASYTYTLGPTGNRTGVLEGNGRTIGYSYDRLYRLTQERVVDPAIGNQTVTFTYDAVGNRTSRTDSNGLTTYSYDADDRLLAAGATTYSYDANGNTLSESAGAAIVAYEYDAENRLITAQGGGTAAHYQYDAQGARVRSTVNGVVTSYLVDANRQYVQVLEERSNDGTLLVRYVYGDDLISQTRGGATSYYLVDGQGSVRALSDASQTVSDTYTYDAFGVLLGSTGATVNAYLYTGQQYDPNVAFYYLRARYYNQAIGRFATADSVDGKIYDPPSLHRYLYARADPTNRVDPSGHESLVETMEGVTISAMEALADKPSLALFWSLARQAALKLAGAAAVACATQAVTSLFSTIGAGGPCDFSRVNVFFSGWGDAPRTSLHIAEAITERPRWATLTRKDPPYPRDGWYNAEAECSPAQRSVVADAYRTADLTCDEYPFNSSEQGGEYNHPSLRLVPSVEQDVQGLRLHYFYDVQCHIRASDPFDGKFVVAPVGPITVGVCGTGR